MKCENRRRGEQNTPTGGDSNQTHEQETGTNKMHEHGGGGQMKHMNKNWDTDTHTDTHIEAHTEVVPTSKLKHCCLEHFHHMQDTKKNMLGQRLNQSQFSVIFISITEENNLRLA